MHAKLGLEIPQHAHLLSDDTITTRHVATIRKMFVGIAEDLEP